MGWSFCRVTHPVARKRYPCGAAEWIYEVDVREHDVSPDDWAVIRRAKKEGNAILPGTRYIKVTGKFDGEMCTFRAREDLDAICKHYDIYDCW